MDARPYHLNNLRRAAEERRKAAAALTAEARRTHLDLAEIFEARAGVVPQATDASNVIQLRPTRSGPVLGAAKKAAKPRKSRQPARHRPAGGRAVPRAG